VQILSLSRLRALFADGDEFSLSMVASRFVLKPNLMFGRAWWRDQGELPHQFHKV